MEYEEYAIGIDLGTTFSCMAILRNGKVEIIPNEIGENTTPSIVSFTDNEILVGEQIQSQLIKNPKKTIYSIKRLMGKDFENIEVQKDIKSNFWTFDIVKPIIGTRPQIRIQNKDGNYLYYFPEQISKLIIEKLLKSAEKYLGFPIKKAVITVPAYFNDEQRNATKLAASSAGLEVLRILNEPTAASLAYGLSRKLPKNENENIDMNNFFNFFNKNDNKERDNINNINNVENNDKNDTNLILVFDLGGGTFDVTLLEIIDGEIFNVIATSGDPHLGGDDFDKKIMDYCLKDFNMKFHINIDEIKKDLRTMNRLKIAAEQAKIILSLDEKTTILIDEFYNKETLKVNITRRQFEDLCQDLFNKLIYPLDKLFEDVNKGISDVNEIVFVGGSTRIPKIKELIQDYFYDVNINDTINPDETVAYGAAIQAAKLMNQGDDIINDIILMDITPFSLGISVENESNIPEIKEKGCLMDVVIPRGTKIPYKKEKKYLNSYDYQENVEIDVYEGEKKYVKDNHFLGRFKLENIPKKKTGEVEIFVTLSLDANGILFVNGFEPSKGIINSIKIINDKGGKSQNEIIKKLNETNKTLISNIDFTQEKNYKKEMIEYYKYYNNTLNRKEKFKYIFNFSKATINFLNSFNFENNDILGNKYFLYIKTLFTSYNLGLNLVEMVTDDYIKEILNFSKYFLYILSSFQNINYKHYIELIKLFKIENMNNLFYDMVVHVMEILEEKANKLKSQKCSFSKYNSKYLYNNCLHISHLFIKYDRDLALVDAGIRKRYNKCIENCKKNIKIINADSLNIIEKTKKSGKLFQNHNNLNREELLILLDNFRLALQKINGINDSASEAIYLANIVKINFLYLNNNNYNQLKINAEHCINLSKATIKKVEKKEWFIEISNILEDLNKKLEDKIKNNEGDFKEKYRKENKEIFDEIQKYRKKSNIEFIEFILQKYPPKSNILRKNQTVKERWDKNKDSFLMILSSKYHPDHFLQKTEEEKLKYTIYDTIASEINSIREEINPNSINLIE